MFTGILTGAGIAGINGIKLNSRRIIARAAVGLFYTELF
jgi:hypothetical protein